MKIKYCDKDEFIVIEQFSAVTPNRLHIVGNNIISDTSGFDIYDDDEETILYSYHDYTVVYDIGEWFIEYTNDTNIYYVFYGHDYDGYFYDCFVSTEPTMERTILVKSGQGKEFVEPTLDITFFDEDGLANYKAVINEENEVEMIEIDTEEKTATKSKLLLNEFNRTLEEKILRLSQSCGNYINNGVDYNNCHFSYTLADQNNLKNAIELAKITKMDAPYHANGNSCDIYSLDDLVNIYVLNQTNLTHHITYFNQLKLYTEKLLTKEEIDNVQYGQPLTGEYLDKYNMIMKQSKKIISTYLGVEESIVDEILGLSTTLSDVL